MDWLGIVILLVGAIGIGYGWVVGVLGRELDGVYVVGGGVEREGEGGGGIW